MHFWWSKDVLSLIYIYYSYSLNFQSWRHMGHSWLTCCEFSHFTMQWMWKQCEHSPQTANPKKKKDTQMFPRDKSHNLWDEAHILVLPSGSCALCAPMVPTVSTALPSRALTAEGISKWCRGLYYIIHAHDLTSKHYRWHWLWMEHYTRNWDFLIFTVTKLTSCSSTLSRNCSSNRQFFTNRNVFVK